MTYKTRRKRDQALTADVLDGQLDLQGLAIKHGLSLDELASWVMKDDVFRLLSALCLLADFQTQFILSQHRVTAAVALVRMASGEGSDADLQRRACVDVLRLNMDRTKPPAESEGQAQAETPVEAIRKLVYGQERSKRV